MSISQNFPEEGPSLNLNFAGSRTLDPRITFTRTSTATVMGREGLIEVVPANTPRFDHSYNPATGEIESLGLLVEEQRTNLLLFSATFQPTSAGAPAAYVVDQIAPDGTLSGSRQTAASPRTFVDYYLGANAQFTFSVYVKGVGEGIGQTIRLQLKNAASDTVIATGAFYTLTSTWTRISVTGTTSGATTGARIEVLGPVSGAPPGTVFWGAQLEAGAFPTSYIPTSGSTATRTADNASMTGSNFSSWFNPSEGTFFARHKIGVGRTSAGSHVYSADLDFQNRISAQYAFLGAGANLNRFRSFVRYTGTIFGDFSPDDSAIEGIFHKTSHSYSITNTTQYLNGSIVGVGTTPTGLPVPIKFEIGKYMEIYDYLNGHISQITYYPTAISNNNLENLTR